VGENGWHPHIHVLIFHPATVDQASVDAAVAELFDTWRAGAVKVLGVGPDREHGISHVWRTSAAEYVTKLQEAGLEAAYADGKRGQYPFGVLEGVQNGDVDSVQLWREYVREMRGKRAIEWSRGLRGEFAVLGEERSDDEVAQAERNGELVATVPAVRWVDMHRRRRSDGRLEVVAFLQDLVADFGPPGRGAWAVAGGGSP